MIQENFKINNKPASNLAFNHLSIQFSLDGFSFCVLNKDEKKFIALYNYHFKETNQTPQKAIDNITKLFGTNPLLKEKYHSVNITHTNNLSALVPKPLFQEEKISSYLSYNNKVLKHDFFAFDELENHDIVNVYVPYVNINNFFIDQFGGFEYKHFSTILIENLIDIYKFSLVPHMFVNVGATHFEIIVIFNRKLQLYNTFEYKTKEDFIYYILFVTEQLKLNPEKFELKLLGAVEKDDELYNIAYSYVRNVSLIENRSKYSFSDDFTEDTKRHFFTLLHQF
tara:strand:+ start:52058 stop:52903 length:846 start_codon:yes stop_codon:yes gene_type:complete